MKNLIREMWASGGPQRLLLVILVVSSLALLIMSMVSLGLIVLDYRVRAMWDQNIRMEQSIAVNSANLRKNQEDIRATEQRIIDEGNDRWLIFQSGNPQFSVPLIDPRDRQIDVKPPITTPTPPPPRVIIKKQTVIIHRKASTPKPWWHP